MSDMNIREKLNLSYVPRWAIVPMLRPQSVADHSWRVAIIVEELINRLILRANFDHTDTVYVMVAALRHDMDEVKTGDIPSLEKPDFKMPESNTGLLLKVADMIEARTWIRMWGHPERVAGVINHTNSKWPAVMSALEEATPGGRYIAECLEVDIATGGR